MAMLVSVTTLTYKKFERIYQAIDSVLAQDYPNIEYIISDDGSPNFPEEEIRSYVERKKRENLVRFEILRHEKNQGTVRNDNDAMRHCTGEIVIPVSADDALMDPTVISRIAKKFEETGCDVLCVTRALYNDAGAFVRNIPTRKAGEILSKDTDNRVQYQRFMTGRYYEAYSGATFSLRREFIERWGYWDERYVLWEDGPFFAQYLWENRVECAFDIVGLRYNDGGVSSGEKHPLLLKDDELFRKTDCVAHIDELSFVARAILKHRLLRCGIPGKKGSIVAALRHPIGLLGIKAYNFSLRFLKD